MSTGPVGTRSLTMRYDLVEEMVLEEVARYCESDVLNTYRVWLICELFRGSITTQELDWSGHRSATS